MEASRRTQLLPPLSGLRKVRDTFAISIARSSQHNTIRSDRRRVNPSPAAHNPKRLSDWVPQDCTALDAQIANDEHDSLIVHVDGLAPVTAKVFQDSSLVEKPCGWSEFALPAVDWIDADPSDYQSGCVDPCSATIPSSVTAQVDKLFAFP